MALIAILTDDKKENKLVDVLVENGFSTKEVDSSTIETILAMEMPDCLIMFNRGDLEPIRMKIEQIKQLDDNLPIVVISEKTNVSDAVELMKSGVFDIFHSPIDYEKLCISCQHAIRLFNLTKRVFFLENQVGCLGAFDNIIGQSTKMQEVFQMISTVAKSDATVLVTGESGTGKELVAKALHNHSNRVKGNFIDINCGAIPRELLENELFGHEKGSFTGADRRYIGCCERANKGTLFLDEICEMEHSLQVKILRMLQERTFNRVGGTERIYSDIRFIAATNRDVVEEVKKGTFREDLYYRLNVVPIRLPALRERKEDIPLLAKSFLEKFSHKNEKIFVDIEAAAIELLINYDWPGNVRELENMIERSVVLNNDSILKARFLPAHLQSVKKRVDIEKFSALKLSDSSVIMPLELVEKHAIEAAMHKCQGNISEAARKLKIGQATMYRKIKQYGLK